MRPNIIEKKTNYKEKIDIIFHYIHHQDIY